MKKILIVFLVFPILILAQTNFDKGEKLFKEGKYEQAQPIFESFLRKSKSFENY